LSENTATNIIQQPHYSVLNSKPTLPDASKASKKSLFSTSDLTLMRVPSKIDNLADALQNTQFLQNAQFFSTVRLALTLSLKLISFKIINREKYF
jgi:hypothetical protein